MKTYTAQITSLVFFLFLTIPLFSQNTEIDSLKLALQNHKEKDSIRVNLLNDLALLYHKEDSDKAANYLEESEETAIAIGFTKGRAKSLYLKGVVEAFESNYRKGFSKYKEAIELYQTIDWKEGIAECYKEMGIFKFNNSNQKQALEYYTKSLEILNRYGKKKEIAVVLDCMGWSYLRIDNYTEARAHLIKALKINEELGDEEGISSCMNGIATSYSYQGNYTVALDYYNQTLEIAKRNSNKNRIMLTLGNMGIVYFYLKKYDKAIELYTETLRLAENTDKDIISKNLNNLGLAYKEKKDNKLAYKYLKKAQKLFNDLNDKPGQAYTLNNIGDIYLKEKEYTKAYENYKQAKNICLEIENHLGLCISYLGLAKVYIHQQNYDKALTNSLESKKLSVKHGFLQYQSDVEELFSKIYKNTGNYKKAFESHQQLKKLNDSLFNKENIEKIAQLEYEYKYKQALDSASIRELQLTKTVTATNRDLEKSQRNYLWAIIGVLLVSILLGSIIFFQKFKNIKTKNENIVTEQKLLRSQMTPHFIFNSLAVLQGMILNKENQKSVSYLSKFSKLLRITLENSRDKTVLLSEEIIAVENYLALQNLENEAYSYTVNIDDTIDSTLFKIPPMLIQPFVENAVKHAFINQKENRKIDVRLEYINKKLTCIITDNGIGINSQGEDYSKDTNSMATAITSERLEMLAKDLKMEGSVTIEDRQQYNGQGTIVSLVIPHKMLAA